MPPPSSPVRAEIPHHARAPSEAGPGAAATAAAGAGHRPVLSESLTRIGRVFFALALLAMGVEHFVFTEFVTGPAPPWPPSVPGGQVWAYLSGAIILAASVSMLTGRHARVLALAAGGIVFAWAVLRFVPLVTADAILGPTWTRAARAVKMCGGILAVAATFPPVAGHPAMVQALLNRTRVFMVLGAVGLASHMIVAGILHFKSPGFIASLIPGWFPGNPVAWTYFAGAALIAGGVGINLPRIAGIASLLSGLMLFSWFWIVHVARELAGLGDGISIFGSLASAGLAFVLSGFYLADRRGPHIRDQGPSARS